MGLEDKLKGYNQSVAIGQLGGLATTVAGVLNADRIAKYVPGVDSLLQKTYNAFDYTIAPGLPILAAASNFIGDQLGFAASLYFFNREKYKGFKGKLRFVKDGFNLGIRHLGSYLISYPIAIAASTAAIATGFLTGFAATIVPYIIESLVTGSSYMIATRGYRKSYSPS